jgi:hypothetical protein
MPKTLVLFHGSSDAITATADAVADGIRSVRFAEVEVRRLAQAGEAAGSSRHRATAAAGLRSGGTVTLSVGSAWVAEASGLEGEDARWALLRALAGLGVVLVPASGDGPEAAKKLGHRVAHVVSWITHAKSHHHH